MRWVNDLVAWCAALMAPFELELRFVSPRTRRHGSEITLSPALTCRVLATGPVFLLQVISDEVMAVTGELFGGYWM
jgi:hypothetical protein